MRVHLAALKLAWQMERCTMSYQLGFFNRPWNPAPLEEAVDAIASLGVKNVGLLGLATGAIVDWQSTEQEIQRVRGLLVARSLRLHALRASVDFSVPLTEAIARFRRLCDNAAALGADTLLEMGAQDPARYEFYLEVMRATAPYAAQKGLRICLKPHGGLSASGAGCLFAVENVGHPAYRLWYDAGNIIYYHNLDPLLELYPLQGQIQGLCIKDCGFSDGRPTVALNPGEGKVDFRALFRALAAAGFQEGPCLVETLAGSSVAEVTANARRAMAYLSAVLEELRLPYSWA